MNFYQQLIEMIHKHLDDSPTDWQVRSELSDLYEDVKKYEEAKLQRWMATHKRTPLIWDDRPHHLLPWHWWVFAHDVGVLANISSRLAYAMPDYRKGFETRQLAEQALLPVLMRFDWPVPDS